MQRARKETQKQRRREAMISAAWELFQTKRYDEVNMIDVAQAVGVAKGTLYLYFEAKEALFLAVLVEQFGVWFGAFRGRLAELDAPLAVEQLAAQLSESLVTRPSLTRLFAITHLVLEFNSDYDEIAAFKRMLRQNVAVTGQMIEERVSFMKADDGAAFLLRVYALLLGVQQLANPAPMAAEVVQKEPGMEMFHHGFAEMFTEMIHLLLLGMAARSR